MSTPQRFLESFFREKLAIYADANARLTPVYAKYFGEPLSERARDFLLTMREVIDDVKESGRSAVIITSIKSDRLPGTALRTRYHLAQTGEDWKITRKDRECFLCQGTGKSGPTPCQHCGGDGWIDRAKDAV